MPVQWTVENHCIFRVIVNTSLLSKIAINEIIMPQQESFSELWTTS